MKSTPMTPLQWILIAVFGLLLVWMLIKRRGDISPEAAKQLVSEGALLLDVRSTSEFGSGHLPGALNVPLSDLTGRLAELGSKERPIIIYCQSGMRSAAAAGMLKHQGFSKVSNLGAMSRW